MDAWPQIRYAPLPMVGGPAVGLIVACVLAALAIGARSAAFIAVAVVALAATTWWATVVWRKLAGDVVALTRDGEMLVGAELVEPLPVAGTSFELASDHSGGWLVVLRHPGERSIRLEARGWKLPEGRTTATAVAEILVALGLAQRD